MRKPDPVATFSQERPLNVQSQIALRYGSSLRECIHSTLSQDVEFFFNRYQTRNAGKSSTTTLATVVVADSM